MTIFASAMTCVATGNRSDSATGTCCEPRPIRGQFRPGADRESRPGVMDGVSSARERRREAELGRGTLNPRAMERCGHGTAGEGHVVATWENGRTSDSATVCSATITSETVSVTLTPHCCSMWE